ncbi:hypothetical protein K2173_009863 [Erythroxylum novogranatense]|uniref:Uncharacterized protein n=1 Tax=Erythroxylum novogranatense TaxID=1862640 RepID=A0AAV8SZ58_9ROSI|nr:hypothetical protein K2173_009863 [Erythroxylum novogranatense]
MNKKQTLVKGRSNCVTKACENPNCAEIGDCCCHLKLSLSYCGLGVYPRDFVQRGWLRALLKFGKGRWYLLQSCNSYYGYILGKQFMLHVSELVLRHPGRTKKQETVSSSTSRSFKSGKRKKKRWMQLMEHNSIFYPLLKLEIFMFCSVKLCLFHCSNFLQIKSSSSHPV